jgi:hypothetical protein
MLIKKNGSLYDSQSYMNINTSLPSSATFLLTNLNAGDLITFVPDASVALVSTDAHVNMFRLSGPSVIAATDTVAARYTDTSGASIGTSLGLFKYLSKDFDTTGSYSISSGLYTVPVSGKYLVTGQIWTNLVTLGANSGALIAIYKNNSFYSYIGKAVGTGSSNAYRYGGSDEVNCVAGDTLAIWVQSDVSTTATTLSGANVISFLRTGN